MKEMCEESERNGKTVMIHVVHSGLYDKKKIKKSTPTNEKLGIDVIYLFSASNIRILALVL